MPKPKHRVLGKITELVVTPEQRAKLLDYTKGTGGLQSLCQRVYDKVGTKGDKLVARLHDVDMADIDRLITRDDSGGWQDLFREIMAANGREVKPPKGN